MLYMGGTYLHYYPCEWMARRINLLFPFLFCQFGIIIISTELISITGRIQSVLSFRFPLPGCSFIALSSSSSVISWATSVVILDQHITITSHRNLTGWPAIKVIAYWSRPLDNCSQRGSNNFIETFQGSCQLWPGIGGTVSRSNRIASRHWCSNWLSTSQGDGHSFRALPEMSMDAPHKPSNAMRIARPATRSTV